MDELLTRDLRLAEHERAALFAFLERFEKKLLSFQQDHASLCAKRDADINFCRENAKKAQEKLEADFAAEKRALEEERTKRLQTVENLISQAKRTNAADEQAFDEAYLRWTNQTSAVLDADDQNETSEYALFRTRLERMESDCKKMEQLASRFEFVTKDVQTAQNISIADAKKRLSEECAAESANCCSTLRECQKSSWKLFLITRGNNSMKRAKQIMLDAKGALARLQTFYKSQSRARWEKFTEESRRMEAELQAKKENARRQLESVQTTCRRDSHAIENDISNRMTKLQKTYQERRNSTVAALQQEDRQTVQKWKQRIEKSYQTFMDELETDFPERAVRNLMRSAWSGEQDMKRTPQAEALRNVLIGQCAIDAAGRNWYAGECGPFVRKVLTARYPYLFQRTAQGNASTVNADILLMPWKFSLEKGENLLFTAPEQLRAKMEAAVQSVLLRLLWAVPTGQAQLLLADAGAVGSFNAIKSIDPALNNRSSTNTVKSILYGDCACNTAQEIRQNIHEKIVQYNSASGLMGGVRSLRQYNADHPMNRNSFLFAALQKFPAGLDDDSIESLRKMAMDCGKWGYSSIFAGTDADIMQADARVKKAASNLAKVCTGLTAMENGCFRVQNGSPMENGSMVAFAPQPDGETLNAMRKCLYDGMLNASTTVIDFERAPDLCPPVEKRYTESAKQGIVVPIGYLEGGTPFHMIFDDSRVHAVICGEPGSGKTNLLHILITNTMLRYDADEVEMYLIDFKHGTEFERYTQGNFPNFRAISIANEPEYALKLLNMLQEEQNRRAALFSPGVNNLRDHPGKLSRILVVVDELYQLTLDAKNSQNRIRAQIMTLLEGFAVQSRSFGIHFVLSTQNLSQIPEMNTIKKSCATRIVLHCDAVDAESTINKQAADQLRGINTLDKGSCVVRVGTSGAPQIEHTAYVEPVNQHMRLLGEIHTHYLEQKRYTRAKVMITAVHADLNSVYQRWFRYNDLSQFREGIFLLGETLSTNGFSEIDLTGKSLWIAGGRSDKAEEAGRSMLYFLLLSLILQKSAGRKNRAIYYCGGTTTANQPVDDGDRAAELAYSMNQRAVRYVTGDALPKLLDSVYEVLRSRSAAGTAQGAEPIYLILEKPEACGMLYARELQMLADILQSGPPLGVYTFLRTRDPRQAVSRFQLSSQVFGSACALECESEMLQTILGSKPEIEPFGMYAAWKGGSRMRIFDLPEKEWAEPVIQKLLST